MDNIIDDYVKGESDNGLLLIDMPTGSGKTFSAQEYIHTSSLKKENKDLKFFFVTSLKKNLKAEELERHFKLGNHADEFCKKVLVLNAVIDDLLLGWCPEVEKAIPDEIRKYSSEDFSWKTFRSDIEYVKKNSKNINSDSPYMEVLRRMEPIFRKRVKKLLEGYKTREEKLFEIHTNSKYKWIGKLYPIVFLSEKQIIIMSMSKAILPFDTLVENPFELYESEMIDGSVFMIDEFDATKNTILKSIIESSIRSDVEYVELFNAIYGGLNRYLLSKDLKTLSSYYDQTKNTRRLRPDERYELLKQRSEEISQMYSLQLHLKTKDTEYENNYLFRDHEFFTIMNSKENRHIYVRRNDDLNINEICYSKEFDPECLSIQKMLSDIESFIRYFEANVYAIAMNYKQNQLFEMDPAKMSTSVQSSVNTVLNFVLHNDVYVRVLSKSIMMREFRNKEKAIESKDNTFCENGFRFYSFINSEEHDQQSRIVMSVFANTPEKIMLKFCERAKVIGISATATLGSVLCNYDLFWLREKLGSNFVELTRDQKKSLEESFESKLIGYSNVKIHTELLGMQDENRIDYDIWSDVFKDEELQREVNGLLLMDDIQAFHIHRYHRIALAFLRFMQHDDIRSFLCLLNGLPDNKKELQNKRLIDILKKIAEENGNGSYEFVILTSQDYDKKKEELEASLSAGKKVFVISTYQTLGVGQDLQYTIPEELKNNVVRTHYEWESPKKDFDAIYLEHPTYLTVDLKKIADMGNLAKCIFETEYLQESGELSRSEAETNIRYAFWKAFGACGRRYSYPVSLKNKRSVRIAATRIVIQAIGRICRTANKNPNIYVFADMNLCSLIDPSVVEGRRLNREFIALVEEIKRHECKPVDRIDDLNIASLNANRANDMIRSYVYYPWTEKTMQIWKKMRETVLRNPTASKQDAERNIFISQNYVVSQKKINTYYYSHENDYTRVEISFGKTESITRQVTQDGSGLTALLKIEGVRDLFIRNGWAVEFTPQEYIMSPVLWNNIYKGALGEVVGAYLFETVLNCKLEEIDDPDLFEAFDYKVPEKPVYIDFKNWHEGITTKQSDYLEKVVEKAKKCHAKSVIIANVLGGELPYENTIDGIRILSVPHMAIGSRFDLVAMGTIHRLIVEAEEESEYEGQ